MKSKFLILALSTLLISGCEIKIPLDTSFLKIDTNQNDNQQIKTNTNEVIGVKEALKNATKQDCLDVYKLFKGFSNYINRTTDTKNTSQLFTKFAGVRKDLGWVDGRLVDLQRFTSSNIMQQPFVKVSNNQIMPETFTEDLRIKFAKLYSDYAEGAKQAYLEKK